MLIILREKNTGKERYISEHCTKNTVQMSYLQITYMHVCICVHTYTHTHVWCIYVYMCYVHICIRMWVYMYTHIYINIWQAIFVKKTMHVTNAEGDPHQMLTAVVG